MRLKFEYQMPLWRNFLGIALCTAGAFGMGGLANTNEKGLRLYHMITFLPEHASLIYWVIAAFCVLATILFCLITVRSLKGPITITLDTDRLIAPKASLKQEIISIPYKQILQASVQKYGRAKIIFIHSLVGDVNLPEAGFKSQYECEKFKKVLTERINA